MKRLLAMAIIIATVLPAGAHEFPSTRRVYIQLDDNKFGVLITWTSATGASTHVMAAMAKLSAQSRKEAERNLEIRALQQAVSGLEVALNGKTLDLSKGRVKLVLEPTKRSGTRRHGIFVLFSHKVGRNDVAAVRIPNDHRHGSGDKLLNRCTTGKCLTSVAETKAETIYRVIWR